jgi:hypothetical protein
MTPAEEEIEELTRNIEGAYRRYERIKSSGMGDPNRPDGKWLNEAITDIMYCQSAARDICEDSGIPIPAICKRDLPPAVPGDYIADPNETRRAAKEALRECKAHPKYKKLVELKAGGWITSYKWMDLNKLLDEPKNLEKAIGSDDIREMHKYVISAAYLLKVYSFLEGLRPQDFKDGVGPRNVRRQEQLSLF